MKRTIFRRLGGLALGLASSAVTAAEWNLLPGPATSGVAVYADTATMQPKHNKFVGFFAGNTVRAWFITDYETSHRWLVHDILSAKHYVEFDCKRATMHMLARLYYRDHMGQGRVLATETEAPAFTPVVPGHAEEAMYAAACPKAEEATAAARTASEPAPAP